MIKVFVLMSTYNGAQFLEEQLNSIFRQEGDFELVIYVRDDGSTDRKTLDLLCSFNKSGKINLIKGDNVGSAESFKLLLKSVPEADYYAFADQDDVWMQDKIMTGIAKLNGTKVPCLYGTTKIIVDKKLRKIKKIHDYVYKTGLYNMLIQGTGIAGCTMIFNHSLRESFMKCPINDFYHDELMVILAELYGKVIFDSNARMYYRSHDNNVFGISIIKQSRLKLRIKKILTFSQRRKTTNISQWMLLLNYDNKNDKRWRLIICASKARKSFYDRVKLFLHKGLKTECIYEYIMYKMGILLGWL